MIASNRLRLWLRRWCLCAFAFCAIDSAAAASLTVEVDAEGAGLEGAVVSLHSASARAAARPVSTSLELVQDGFDPHVLPVTTGSRVVFPKRDDARHHIYSFSAAHRFELPLYGDGPAQPVVFGTPGVVELGCNIHDWMIGYIVVLDTPYFGTTDAGGDVRLDAPRGDYTLQVWHERLDEDADVRVTRAVHVGAGSIERVTLDLEAPRKAPPPADVRLQRLRQRFQGSERGG